MVMKLLILKDSNKLWNPTIIKRKLIIRFKEQLLLLNFRYNDGSTLSSSTLKLNNTLETFSDETSTKSNYDKLLLASSILVYNKPEVKYAYPVK